jgi:RHS repeat-associated protein
MKATAVAHSGVHCVRLHAASYYRARYYDSAIARFISEDPIRFSGGSDFYVYVNNKPTMGTDPLGLKIKLCTRRGFAWAGGGVGNHAFLYDTERHINCGKGEGNHPYGTEDLNAQGTYCIDVPGTEDQGVADLAMSCCRRATQNGFSGKGFESWAARHFIWPFGKYKYDCHSFAENCLREAGVSDPPAAPGGRLGCRGKECEDNGPHAIK